MSENGEIEIVDQIEKLLLSCDGSKGSEFVTSGTLPTAPVPDITLSDGTLLRFPLVEEDLRGARLTRSHFGRGTETVLDPSVRNSWELNPNDFTIQNAGWDKFVSTELIPSVTKAFVITEPVLASLHKLLVYKKGSFFKPHTDSEKEDRMFATLVVQLPSKYRGGELVVRHDSQEKKIDFSTTAEEEVQLGTHFTAFYCDCEHEVLPVTDGIRACLVYNLALAGATPKIPTAPSPSNSDASDLLRLFRGLGDKDWKFVWVLAHQYTPKNLTFENLKSEDKAVATIMQSIAKEAGIIVMLGILDKHIERQNGDSSCDEVFGYHYSPAKRGQQDDKKDDEDEDEGDEDSSEEGRWNISFPSSASSKNDYFFSASYHVSHLILSMQDDDVNKGKPFAANFLGVERYDVVPAVRRSNMKVYSKKAVPTGNEGTDVSLHYKHAVMLLVNQKSAMKILCRYFRQDDEDGEPWGVAECWLVTKIRQFQANPQDMELKENLKHWLIFPLLMDSTLLQEIGTVVLQLQDKAICSKFVDYYWDTILEESNFLRSLLALSVEKGWNEIGEKLSKPLKTLPTAINFVDAITEIAGTQAQNKEPLSVLLKAGLNAVGNANLIQRLEDCELLLKIWRAALQVKLDIFAFSISLPFSVVVESLLRAGADSPLCGDLEWIAEHFLVILNTKASQESPQYSNVRNDFHSCVCEDCIEVQCFMKSENVAYRMKANKERRDHVQYRVGTKDLTFITEKGGRPETLVITKLNPQLLGEDDKEMAKTLLPKLEAILGVRPTPSFSKK